jgi:phosphoribosylformylglycinamidine synthase I
MIAAKPRVLVLRAPGTNCDEETAFAFEQAGACVERIHIRQILDSPDLTKQFQILCLPGGFSYGDDIAAGRILANQIRYYLRDAMEEFRQTEKLVLGVCNGFQVLIKSGILADSSPRSPATLTWNDSGRFEDRWVYLSVDGDKCPMLSGVTRMYLPIAHAEGKFVASDSGTLDSLGQSGQLVLRYSDSSGSTNGQIGYPENPNGSEGHVAGMCDTTGRVLGLMPHPERFIDPTHHPRWTRGEAGERGDGIAIFENAVSYFG